MDHLTEETVDREVDAIASEAGPDPVAQAQQEQQQQENQQTEQGEAEYRQLLREVMAPGFEVMAPAWGITGDEIDALANCYATLLQKYMPGGPGQYGPEIAAVVTTVAILGPRMKKPRKLEGVKSKGEPGETRENPGHNPEPGEGAE